MWRTLTILVCALLLMPPMGVAFLIAGLKYEEISERSRRVELDYPWDMALSDEMRIFYLLPEGLYSAELYLVDQSAGLSATETHVLWVQYSVENKQHMLLDSGRREVTLSSLRPAKVFWPSVDLAKKEDRSGVIILRVSSREDGAPLPRNARLRLYSYSDLYKQDIDELKNYRRDLLEEEHGLPVQPSGEHDRDARVEGVGHRLDLYQNIGGSFHHTVLAEM